MSDIAFRPATAFLDTSRIASGPLAIVALAVKAALVTNPEAAIIARFLAAPATRREA